MLGQEEVAKHFTASLLTFQRRHYGCRMLRGQQGAISDLVKALANGGPAVAWFIERHRPGYIATDNTPRPCARTPRQQHSGPHPGRPLGTPVTSKTYRFPGFGHNLHPQHHHRRRRLDGTVDNYELSYELGSLSIR
jgi:hypothetical protein